jgi:hypothetical protein
MINQELLNYIAFNLDRGATWSSVRKNLLGVGWTDAALEENYQEYLKNKILPIVAPPHAIQTTDQMTESQKQEVHASFILEDKGKKDESAKAEIFEQETLPKEESLEFDPVLSEYTDQTKQVTSDLMIPLKEKRKVNLKWLGISLVFLILLAAGGGVFAYYQYVFPQQVLDQMVKNYMSTTNADKTWETAVAVKSQATAKEAIPIEVSEGSLDVKYFSGSFNVKVDSDVSSLEKIKGTTIFDFEATVKPDAQSLVSKSVSGAAEMRIDDNLLFWSIKDFQGIDNFSEGAQLKDYFEQSIKNQWVKWALPQPTDGSSYYAEIQKRIDEQKQATLKFYNTYKPDIQKALKIKVIGSEKLDDLDCFNYRIGLDRQGVWEISKTFAQDYYKQHPESHQPTISDWKDYEDAYNNYIWPRMEKTSILIWVAKNNPHLKKFVIDYKESFDSASESPVSYVSINITETFKKLDAGSVVVDIPQNTKTFEEVIYPFFAISSTAAQNQAQAARIKADMDQLRTVATLQEIQYKTYVGFATTGDGKMLLSDINRYGGKAAIVRIAKDKFCVTKELQKDGGKYWCVDSAGYAGDSTACTKTNYACQ